MTAAAPTAELTNRTESVDRSDLCPRFLDHLRFVDIESVIGGGVVPGQSKYLLLGFGPDDLVALRSQIAAAQFLSHIASPAKGEAVSGRAGAFSGSTPNVWSRRHVSVFPKIVRGLP